MAAGGRAGKEDSGGEQGLGFRDGVSGQRCPQSVFSHHSSFYVQPTVYWGFLPEVLVVFGEAGLETQAGHPWDYGPAGRLPCVCCLGRKAPGKLLSCAHNLMCLHEVFIPH